MSDPDLLSNPDKLARKMDSQTAESMTHTLKLHWSELNENNMLPLLLINQMKGI